MVSDKGILRFEPLLSKLSFHSSPNRLVDKLWTNYSLEQACITHTWNLGTIDRIINMTHLNKALCLISFSWEFKSQALELYEAAPLHSHIGRLYQKCTHNYAFQQTYAICLLRGKPHPTTFILMVQVLLPYGMYLLSSTSITLIVYFHHWTQDLTLI